MLKPKKVVLAYSGGLDTSVIMKWLQQTYGCEVVTFTADIGQGEEIEPARAKAIKMGERLTVDDVAIKRPGYGIEPRFYEQVLGRSVIRNLAADAVLDWSDLA